MEAMLQKVTESDVLVVMWNIATRSNGPELTSSSHFSWWFHVRTTIHAKVGGLLQPGIITTVW